MSSGDIVALVWGVIVGALCFFMVARSGGKHKKTKDEESGDKGSQAPEGSEENKP